MYLNLQRILIIVLFLAIVDGRRRTKTTTTTTSSPIPSTTTTRLTTTTSSPIPSTTTTRLTTTTSSSAPSTTTTRLTTTTSSPIPSTTTTRLTTTTSSPIPSTTTTRLTTTTSSSAPSTTTTRLTTTTTVATITTTTTPVVATTTTTIISTTPSGSTTTTTPLFNLFRTQALEENNYLRATHCAAPLTVSYNLTIIAQTYAQVLCANKSALAHSGNRYLGNPLGENLYAVTRSSPFTLDARNGSSPVDSWYSEVAYYNYSNPVYSAGTGHFTQLVWLESQYFGLGYCCSNDSLKCYVVANYYPAGNYRGSFGTNVLPRTCG